MPKTCNQPAPITCDQLVHVLSLYQQKPIDTQPICATDCVCTHPFYTVACACTRPLYTGVCIHLLRARVFTFLKLWHFASSVTSTYNLSLCPTCTYAICIHVHTYPLNQIHICLSSHVPYMCIQSWSTVITLTWTRHQKITDMQPQTTLTTSPTHHNQNPQPCTKKYKLFLNT
jgi:hypothetical protein